MSDYAGWLAGAIFAAKSAASRRSASGAGELSGGAGRDSLAYHGTTPPMTADVRMSGHRSQRR